MDNRQQTLNFSAGNGAVRKALAELRAGFSEWGMSGGLSSMTELVLAEALNNIVEHATADRSDGMVQLSTQYRDTLLTCELYDNGVPIPGLKLPKGKLPEIGTSLEDLPEGGFGWHLIRSLTQDLEYNRKGDWNCLSFRLTDNPAFC